MANANSLPRISLRTADAFDVVASRGREATTVNASAVHRLPTHTFSQMCSLQEGGNYIFLKFVEVKQVV